VFITKFSYSKMLYFLSFAENISSSYYQKKWRHFLNHLYSVFVAFLYVFGLPAVSFSSFFLDYLVRFLPKTCRDNNKFDEYQAGRLLYHNYIINSNKINISATKVAWVWVRFSILPTEGFNLNEISWESTYNIVQYVEVSKNWTE
jgi:hypothetical protein